MAEIYERWVAAHAVIVLAPTCWYQSPSPLKLMIDRMEWMGLIDAGAAAKFDRYIGYCEPYDNSHEALDRDEAVQEEARNDARSVVQAAQELRAGRLTTPDKQIKWPQPKRVPNRNAGLACAAHAACFRMAFSFACDMSVGRRGGLRSHQRAGGRILRLLRNEARPRGLKGRSSMNKAQLEQAPGP